MNLAFGHAALLWGMALFVVPLLIHLLNRRRYRVLRWAAQDFLLQAFQRTRRRLRLESLLLLIARCLLVALLALALARPTAPSSSPLSAFSAVRRHLVLAVDTSYSMTRRTGDGATCLERAKVQAKRLVDGLREDRGDLLTLVTLGEPPQVRLDASPDLDRAATLIDELKPSFAGADLIRAIDLLRADVLGREPGLQEIFLVTDLQRATFQPGRTAPAGLDAAASGEAAPASALRQLVAEKDVEVTLVDVGEDAPARNLAVEDLAARPQNVVVGEIVTFTATVRNLSERPQNGVRGTFVIDGRVDQAKQVTFDVAAGAATSVECSTIYRDALPTSTVEFTVDEDDLPADDARYLSFPVDVSVKVLLVDGDPAHPDPELRETGRLGRILNPFDDAETGTIFRLTTIDDRKFNQRSENLSDYDLIVLANVARIDEEVAKDLGDAVRSGRGLLIFLGDNVDPTAWNERLHRADGSGLLPARLGEVRGDPRKQDDVAFHAVADDFDHPILDLFADPVLQPSLTSRRSVWRFFAVDVTAKDTATSVVLRVDDDPASPSPLVLEKPAGRGRVMLWTTTADADWADFGKSGNEFVFLPLMHETAVYLTLEDLGRFNLGVGQPIRKTTRSVPGEISITLPDGTRDTDIDAPSELEYGEYVLRPWTRTATPGFYALDLTYPLAGAGNDSGSRVTEHFAVNLDVAESDLSRIDERGFATLYPEVPVHFMREVGALPEARGDPREGDLWRAVLWAVAALLLLEMSMAWWFGRARGAAA